MKFKYYEDPNRARNLALRILGYDVGDDRFLRIFGETSKLIRASARSCVTAHDDLFAEDELHYIEEFLGLSFVLLQAKICRVEEAAQACPLFRRVEQRRARPQNVLKVCPAQNRTGTADAQDC
jgi:hypothetical protein